MLPNQIQTRSTLDLVVFCRCQVAVVFVVFDRICDWFVLAPPIFQLETALISSSLWSMRSLDLHFAHELNDTLHLCHPHLMIPLSWTLNQHSTVATDLQWNLPHLCWLRSTPSCEQLPANSRRLGFGSRTTPTMQRFTSGLNQISWTFLPWQRNRSGKLGSRSMVDTQPSQLISTCTVLWSIAH